jgi:hypothetical protein
MGLKLARVAVIVALVIALAAPAMAQSIKVTGDMGETWLKWSWTNNDSVAVYVDGVFVTNSTLGYYYLSGAKANSEHRLELRNATNESELLAKSTLRTNPQAGTLWLFIGICFIFGLIILFLQDKIKVIITAILGLVIASYGRSLAYNYYGLEWVFTGFVAFMLVFAGLALYEQAKESLSWW